MALSDSPIGRAAKTGSRRRPVAAKAKRWGDAQKIELIKLYLMTGNLALSAASLKIPEVTARLWKQSQWWKELESELRLQQDFKLSSSLQKIVDKSTEVIQDRLIRGDFIYDSKRGEMIRKPVAMKDAHRVAIDMIDKQQMLEKKAQGGTSQEVAIDKFIKLAEKFAALASKTEQKPPVEVTDVIYITEKVDTPRDNERDNGMDKEAIEDEVKALDDGIEDLDFIGEDDCDEDLDDRYSDGDR